ncbi:5-formyltetrahydrofolate cyclo-ligase [Uliginosibacterium flavum]|uniref:5-formyltetrahydrofolate cyclo-ligase n=1 Tax=Uliginosibacterium flavum TaxID=1396831 RepID=A0ABV2TPG5_9RHOO
MTRPETDRKALRSRLIAEREALAPALRSQLAAKLAGHLGDLLNRLNPQTLGFCWPFRAEPDLVEFLVEWQAQDFGRQLALPVVPATPGSLVFHLWQPGEPLVADRFGIPAPQGTPSAALQAVLVPVNGFDARGYRIGYGGGFFDRTLASLRPAPISIGVGYELARLDDAQPQLHDLPLDWIVTEAGIVVSPAR